MRRLSIVIAVAAMFGLVGVASAHYGELHYIFQFPDDLVPTIDGDISDWDIVPDMYWVPMEELIEHYFGNPVDLENCNVKEAWGWNPTTNKLYFATWIYDDVRLAEGEYFSIYLDPGHKGLGPDQIINNAWTEDEKKRWHFALVQKYYFMRYEKGQGILFPFTGTPATWATEPPYGDAAVKYLSGERGSGGPAELTTELYVTPWDDLNAVGGPDESKIWQLQEGEVIGAEIALRDTDDPDVKGITGRCSPARKTNGRTPRCGATGFCLLWRRALSLSSPLPGVGSSRRSFGNP